MSTPAEIFASTTSMTVKGVKRIAVIGGGPSGMGTVKALNAEPAEFIIDLYEARNKLGGIWNYNKTESNDIQLSPMYKKLETNIFYKTMEYTDFHFPENTEDFPSRQEVLKYLHLYSETIGKCNLHLDTKVVSVEKKDDEWVVLSSNPDGNTSRSYDAVVVANGHFEVPRYPKVLGLDEWTQKDPDSVSHAKFYDTPDRFKDKTVLVVGGVASGSDIAVQSTLTAKKVIVSCDETSVLTEIQNPYLELIPRIDLYDFKTRSISFGTSQIGGIDDIIFCTGYLYSVPFLKLDLCRHRYIQDLYKHIFYVEDPTLTFVGLGKDVTPFPFAESQASIIARYYSGRLKLPPTEEMIKSSNKDLEEKGVRLHGLKFPKEGDYIAELFKMIEDQNLWEGFIFNKYEGEKLARKKRVTELKLKRIIENNRKVLQARMKHRSIETD